MNGKYVALLCANGTNYLVFGKKKVIFARYYFIIISSKKGSFLIRGIVNIHL